MATQIADTFNSGGRGSPNAWSPASTSAFNWTQQVGTSTMGYNGVSNIGTLTGDTSTNVMTLGTKNFYYTQNVCSMTKTTSVNSTMGVINRVVGTNTYYLAAFTNGTLTLSAVVNGTATSLGTYTFSETVNTAYSVKLQVSGQISNTVSAKIWATSGSEPGSYQITATDSSISAPGLPGVYGICNSAGETLSYTSFTSVDPPSYPSQLGNTSYGINIVNNIYSDPTGIQMLRDAINAGYTWVRWQSTTWKSIETSQGVYDFSSLDPIVQTANAAGINFYLVVRVPPPWYLINPCNNSTYQLMDVNGAKLFAQQLVNHYNNGSAGTLQCIEWGNEDYSKGYGNCPDGSYAAALMASVYPAIKQLNSSILVGPPATYMGGRLTPWWYGKFFAAGGGNYVDFINIHNYPCPAGPNDPQGNEGGKTDLQLLAVVHQTLVSNGYPNLPIWITENSWAVTNSTCTVSAANQSLFYIEMLDDLYSIYPQVVKHFWFDIGSLTVNSGASETYRQAYTAFQSFSQTYPNLGGNSGLTVVPTFLAFTDYVNSTTPSQPVTLTNNIGVSGSYSTSISYAQGNSWLSVSPATGTIPANGQTGVSVSVNDTGLSVGVYNATITWTMGTFQETTSVQLTVVPVPPPFTATPQINVVMTQFNAIPVTQPALLTNTIPSIQEGWSGSISYLSGSNWLSITPMSGFIGGSYPATANVTCYISTQFLGVGNYTAVITWVGGNSQHTTVVSLQVVSGGSNPGGSSDEGVVRQGTYEVSQAIPLGGSAQKILSMETHPQPTVLNVLVADIKRVVKWVEENI